MLTLLLLLTLTGTAQAYYEPLPHSEMSKMHLKPLAKLPSRSERCSDAGCDRIHFDETVEIIHNWAWVDGQNHFDVNWNNKRLHFPIKPFSVLSDVYTYERGQFKYFLVQFRHAGATGLAGFATTIIVLSRSGVSIEKVAELGSFSFEQWQFVKAKPNRAFFITTDLWRHRGDEPPHFRHNYWYYQVWEMRDGKISETQLPSLPTLRLFTEDEHKFIYADIPEEIFAKGSLAFENGSAKRRVTSHSRLR